MLLRCYPKITEFIYELFNQAPAADYRFVPIYSYGFFVACGFFSAAYFAVKEMKRRESLGLLAGNTVEVTLSNNYTLVQIILYSVLAFVVSYKIIGIVAYQPQLSSGTIAFNSYMLSLKQGNLLGGILIGLTTAYLFYSKKKGSVRQIEKKIVTIHPSDNIGDLVLIAAILGILGAAFFNYLENPGDYVNFNKDPIGSLFSGLSVFGGLICAGLGFAGYAYWKKFDVIHFIDSIAPGYVLANGIGRIGCQVAGDGDWGVANFHAKPSWLPDFLWRDNYAYHIINCNPAIDISIPDCINADNCCQLANAAYPTPLYEFAMCATIFLILWAIRKRITYMPGMLFSVFMILIGIQRFTIEQLRDLSGRNTYSFLNIQLRQSEIISMVMTLAGIILAAYLWRKFNSNTKIR